ncbi:MAG: hypothetical protein LQ345_002611 [Seirophora villosa]|nr:MAG: hypothetical protein LQ345_002611 [Seirophora villosa]
MRLQVWPAKDFAHLFGINLKPHPVFGSPDGSSNSDSARDDVSERDDVSARDNASARDDASAKDDTSERENASDGDDARIASDNENSPSPKLVPSDQRDEENDSDNNNEDDKIDFNGDDPADDGSNADRFDGNRSDGAGSGLEENGSEEAGSDADGSDDENRGDQNRSGQPRKIMLDAGSTGSHLTQILVAHWLEKCLKDEDGQHVECNRAKGSWLPTRLIDVEETSENGALRLVSPVETPGAFEPDRRYITLSHCWGEWGSKELPVLKIANERDRFDHGIHPEDLPPTFQHAVEVARWLEVRWLWIDSLCIVQDSNEDWQREAPLMHNVYKEGFLNIAASSVDDARGGLFQKRSTFAIKPLKLSLPGIDKEWYMTLDERNMFDWVNEEPLSERAWVFQERHLARRILHFTDDQVFWECCAKAPYFANEIFPEGAPLANIFDNKPKMQTESLLKPPLPSRAGVDGLWEQLCQMYSEKQLSHEGDKLVALLGLAIEFKTLLPQDEYHAGMWDSTMPRSLLWEVAQYDSQPSRRQIDVAPSWSWASIQGPIQKQFRYEPEEERYVSVVDIKVGSLSDTRWGLSKPNLIISAFLRRVTVKDNLAVNSVIPPTFDNKKEILIHQGSHRLTIKDTFLQGISYSLDSKIDREETDAYFLFLTWSEGHNDHPKKELSGLLLESTTESNTSRRIGTLRISSYGAIAAKYQVKEDVLDPVAVWNSFVEKLQYHDRKVAVAEEEDEVTQFSRLHVSESVTERLYDHKSNIDDSGMETLEPREIVLQ